MTPPIDKKTKKKRNDRNSSSKGLKLKEHIYFECNFYFIPMYTYQLTREEKFHDGSFEYSSAFKARDR